MSMTDEDSAVEIIDLTEAETEAYIRGVMAEAGYTYEELYDMYRTKTMETFEASYAWSLASYFWPPESLDEDISKKPDNILAPVLVD